MLQNLHIDAELIVTFNNIPFLLVADGNYVVVNFKDFNALDQLMKAVGNLPDFSPKDETSSGGGPLKKLSDANQKIRDLGLMVEVRVGSKTYVVLGGNSASIKPAAIFGKIGSFFGR